MGENCGPMRAAALRIRFWLFNAAKAQQPSWPGIKKRDADEPSRSSLQLRVKRPARPIIELITPLRSSFINNRNVINGRSCGEILAIINAQCFALHFSSNRIHRSFRSFCLLRDIFFFFFAHSWRRFQVIINVRLIEKVFALVRVRLLSYQN